jgi:hypothetical protein
MKRKRKLKPVRIEAWHLQTPPKLAGVGRKVEKAVLERVTWKANAGSTEVCDQMMQWFMGENSPFVD